MGLFGNYNQHWTSSIPQVSSSTGEIKVCDHVHLKDFYVNPQASTYYDQVDLYFTVNMFAMKGTSSEDCVIDQTQVGHALTGGTSYPTATYKQFF